MNTKLVFILCVLIIFVVYSSSNTNLHFDQDLPDWNAKSSTHILFTRYKETDMSIILKPFINKKDTTIFIYNKGNDTPTGIPDDATNVNIINIPNLGWDSYGYIHHVINNYDNLPDYIYNIHASAQYLFSKYELLIDILNESQNNKYYYGGRLIECDLGFYLNNWSATYNLNRLYNPDHVYTISSIRPIKKWLLTKIKKIPDFAISKPNYIYHNYGGMFFVHKSKILKYDKSFYLKIFNEISVWQSEVNHYLERSWFIFYND
jgi:hypothetical protein